MRKKELNTPNFVRDDNPEPVQDFKVVLGKGNTSKGVHGIYIYNPNTCNYTAYAI